MKIDGLARDQAPALAIPLGFYAVAFVAWAGFGVSLFLADAWALTSAFSQSALAATHLLVLGMLAAIMLGSLGQMCPVVAGIRVRAIELAYVAQALMLAGVVALTWCMCTSNLGAFILGLLALALGAFFFLVPLLVALFSQRLALPTPRGMRSALLAFAGVWLVGLLMWRGHIDGQFPGARSVWLPTHAALAFGGWVGGLLMAISWQVVPMFYLAPSLGAKECHQNLTMVASGSALLLAALVATCFIQNAIWTSIPAIVGGVMIVVITHVRHSITMLRAIAARRRKRVDTTVWFWKIGLWCAPLSLLAAVLAFLGPAWSGGWPVALWFLIWGWAMSIVLGTLLRIVPFLAWFHWLSPWIGKSAKLPPAMNELVAVGRIRRSFALHLLSLAAGLLALGWPLRATLTAFGVAMMVEWVHLTDTLVRALLRAWRWRRSTMSGYVDQSASDVH
jgi:hypothetical protein